MHIGWHLAPAGLGSALAAFLSMFGADAAGAEGMTERQSACSRFETIVIGKIAENPSKVLPKLQPFAHRLALELRDPGIRYADSIVAHDLPKMAELLRDGYTPAVQAVLAHT